MLLPGPFSGIFRDIYIVFLLNCSYTALTQWRRQGGGGGGRGQGCWYLSARHPEPARVQGAYGRRSEMTISTTYILALYFEMDRLRECLDDSVMLIVASRDAFQGHGTEQAAEKHLVAMDSII